MTAADTAGPRYGFLKELHDALSHFYDYAYLINRQPLPELTAAQNSEPTATTHELRRLVLDALEELRPRPSVPASDPSWRPYSVIYSRYILGKELDEVESELALGRRQIQREQQRGLLALAQALWGKRSSPTRERTEAGGGRTGASAPTTIGLVGADPRACPPLQGSPLRQEISRLAAEAESIQLQQLLASAVAATQPLASQYGVRLQQVPGSAERMLGDPSLLRQLAVAALSFAIRAAPGDDLLVSTGRAGSVATLRVETQGGQGRPPLPDRCVVADAPVRPAHVLPEALTALAEAQQAQVTCETGEGGMWLEIRLPAGHGEPAIAIVEDNLDVVALFARYLEGQGYRLLPIREGEEVLDRLGELVPDAIILDVMMRDVDGWEILQQLKAEPNLRHIPVVVCSVLDEPELARSIGAQAYLRKPVRPAQLLECLAGLSLR